MKRANGAIIAGLLLFSLLLAGCGFEPENAETINVAGHTDMTIAPDLARVYAGVSLLKPTAAGAQTEADNIISAIIDGLQQQGITESDIETENMILYEEKEWVDNGAYTKSVGWRATRTLKIKTDDLSMIGGIVDVAVKNGANRITAIEYSLSIVKDDASKQLVLAKATNNAREKAQTIADNLGVALGRIVSAAESNYVSIPYKYTMANNVGAAATEESAKITPSDVIVSADLTLVYAIKQ